MRAMVLLAWNPSATMSNEFDGHVLPASRAPHGRSYQGCLFAPLPSLPTVASPPQAISFLATLDVPVLLQDTVLFSTLTLPCAIHCLFALKMLEQGQTGEEEIAFTHPGGEGRTCVVPDNRKFLLALRMPRGAVLSPT